MAGSEDPVTVPLPAAAVDSPAERPLGILLVSASAVVFGLTGVLTRSIHADPLVITCWRGFFGSVLIAAYVLWRRRRSGTRRSLRLGWRGWLLAVEGAAASVAFIAAFKLTYVANVAVIYATAPFIAALLFLGEMPPATSLAGSALVLAAVFGHAGHDWSAARAQAAGMRKAEKIPTVTEPS